MGMGIRPLFFYRSPEWMAFSSDIRGLITLPDMPTDVNPDWLYRAVCGYDTADFLLISFTRLQALSASF